MNSVKKGMIWSFIERFSTQGIGFVMNIVIARLVAPEMYGLIALIQVFISIAQVFIDSGFGNALIQKRDRTEVDFHTVFIFNIVISVFLYIIFFLCAPLIANFYGEPKLTLLTRMVAITLLISSLSIVQRTKLTIQLDFKKQSIASLLATIISGIIGIVMAYKGFEIWALVAQQLISHIIQLVVLTIVSKWRPMIIFSYESFKTMFSFGSKLLVNNLITSFYINLANLFIGKCYSPSSLAFYNRGFNLSLIVSTNIEGVLQRIIYPITCESQNDRERLVQCYHKYLHLSHYIILPILTIICILAKPTIYALLTEKWLPAAIYLSLFCINFMFYAWIDQATSIVNAIGRSDANLKGSFIKRPLAFIFLFFSLNISVEAICIASIFASFTEWLVQLMIVKKYIGLSLREQIRTQLDIILVCITLAVVVYFTSLLFRMMWFKLIFASIIGIVYFFIVTWVIKMKESIMIIDYIKKLLNKNN